MMKLYGSGAPPPGGAGGFPPGGFPGGANQPGTDESGYVL